MPRIFVSYSRVDRVSAEDITKRLRDVYGHDNVWMDDELSGGIYGGRKSSELLTPPIFFSIYYLTMRLIRLIAVLNTKRPSAYANALSPPKSP